jgi:DNA-binding response OmpR family regulator
MSLRTRLLLALGYLVVLVTIAFAVPLALNLRDRTREEVRSEARSQVGVLAAGSAETLDVHIGFLRRKLGDDAADPRYLRTVRGVGFLLAAPGTP